ncbi:hypothetical protein ETT73_01955 [Streptococcus pyogenes]|nr:hypothetical protein ETT73_01955 [Streptococcus pyogenes]
MLKTGNTFFSGIKAPFSTHGSLNPKKTTPIRGGLTTKGTIPIIADSCGKGGTKATSTKLLIKFLFYFK